jgi:Zn-dependent peptidase ImmA (M78 family)
MRTEVNININMLSWAITRAGFDMHEFTKRVPNVIEWIDGQKKPTIKQLEEFSKRVHLPFGYFFLPEPPKEKLPIPFFRTNNTQATHVSVNVYDTILLIQQRQDWLRNYLKENDFDVLPYVGKYNNQFNVLKVVDSIRETLGLTVNWASQQRTWEDALNFLTNQIEDKGIIIVFNGVVDNNTHRNIPVDECRGFVLVDEIAPFMFVNNADSKSAQIFTIVHELAHIWTGHSAGFDFRRLEPANDTIEILCDKIAAEFLVPESVFIKVWNENPDIKFASKYFKVSEIVIARRALDTGKITKNMFYAFYENYFHREYVKKEHQNSGGDFYATTRKRLSVTFAAHINNAVKTGKLLYRDAYRLTSLKPDTFQKFFNERGSRL